VKKYLDRRWKKGLAIGSAAIGLFVILAAGFLVIFSPRFTPLIEGAKFRAELDKQTSKGLHFQGNYEPIRRTGFASAWTPGFQAEDGVKAMRSLDARDVSATFNPWGVFLRRWQLDDVFIRRGVVEVQTYQPKPDPPKHRPWYAIFMPDRVYLRRVVCPDADVVWQLQGKRSGIFGTQLLITPHGRDFEYRAQGGTLRSAKLAPEMTVKAIHMLITKQILEVYQLELATREGGTIRVTGDAGMRDEKHVDAKLEFAAIAIAPWLPVSLRQGVSGLADGRVMWTGSEQTLEASSGEGEVRLRDGELSDMPLLDHLAAATGKKKLEHVPLDRCALTFQWKYPTFEVTSFELGSAGRLAVHGTARVGKGGSLEATVELGLAPDLLDWLPRAREDIFTRSHGGLLWTTVRLSGSLDAPQNDLTPRLASALKNDPAAATGLFFRGIGEWFEQKARGR
jgi:hypothetical protein